MKPHILFCVPNILRRPNNNNRLFTLATLYLSQSAIEADWSASVVDAYFDNLSIDETVGQILSIANLCAIGFTLNNEEMYDVSLEIITKVRNAKQTDVHVIGGGYFSTAACERILSKTNHYNYIVRGEGELALNRLLHSIKANCDTPSFYNLAFRRDGETISINGKGPTEGNLDKLKYIDYLSVSTTIQPEEWSLVTSRGCTEKCTFCSIGPHWSKYGEWRAHSAQWVVENISYLVGSQGAKFIQMVDDQFIGSKESIIRAWDIVKLMREQSLSVRFNIMCRADTVLNNRELLIAMKTVGLEAVFMGIETSDPTISLKFSKNSDRTTDVGAVALLNDLGLEAQSGTIIFHPWMSVQSLKNDIQFFSHLVETFPSFTILGLNELDVFKRTGLGQMFGDSNQDWRYNWLEDHKPIYKVYYDWLNFQERILFPFVTGLAQHDLHPIGRPIALLQLRALEVIVDAYERLVPEPIMLLDLMTLAINMLSEQFGMPRVIESFLDRDEENMQIVAERCFERSQ